MKIDKRGYIPQKEIEWAESYQRRILPPGLKSPKKGYVYKSLENLEVDTVFWFNAPGSGGDSAILEKGERIWIYANVEPQPLEIFARPVEYEALETRFVPEEIKGLTCYAGYSIVIGIEALNKNFKRISKNYSEHNSIKQNSNISFLPMKAIRWVLFLPIAIVSSILFSSLFNWFSHIIFPDWKIIKIISVINWLGTGVVSAAIWITVGMKIAPSKNQFSKWFLLTPLFLVSIVTLYMSIYHPQQTWNIPSNSIKGTIGQMLLGSSSLLTAFMFAFSKPLEFT